MEICTGKFTVSIREDANGGIFVLLTNGGECIPGIPGKHYAGYAGAVRGGNKMLEKAQR